MKFASYDIVFQEVPDEVTLAINITGCPNRCPGCHSPHLWEDKGLELDEEAVNSLLADYGKSITCVGLMGGDAFVDEVYSLAQYIQEKGYKTAWYSGREALPADFPKHLFAYVKVGPYIASCGGLKSKTTNQRLYRIENGEMIDITYRMQRRG